MLQLKLNVEVQLIREQAIKENLFDVRPQTEDHKLKKDDVVELGKTLVIDRVLQLKYLDSKMKSLENKLSNKFPSLKF